MTDAVFRHGCSWFANGMEEVGDKGISILPVQQGEARRFVHEAHPFDRGAVADWFPTGVPPELMSSIYMRLPMSFCAGCGEDLDSLIREHREEFDELSRATHSGMAHERGIVDPLGPPVGVSVGEVSEREVRSLGHECAAFTSLLADSRPKGFRIGGVHEAGVRMFVLEARPFSKGTLAKYLPGQSGPNLGIAVQMRVPLLFCPFCGQDLDRVIAEHQDDFDRFARRSVAVEW